MIATKKHTKHINIASAVERMEGVSTINELLSGQTYADEVQERGQPIIDKVLAEAGIIMDESAEQRGYVSEDVGLSMERELARMFHLDKQHLRDIENEYT